MDKKSNVITGGIGNKLTVPMKHEVESLYPKIFINEDAEKEFMDKVRKYNEGVRKC